MEPNASCPDEGTLAACRLINEVKQGTGNIIEGDTAMLPDACTYSTHFTHDCQVKSGTISAYASVW